MDAELKGLREEIAQLRKEIAALRAERVTIIMPPAQLPAPAPVNPAWLWPVTTYSGAEVGDSAAPLMNRLR